MTFMLPDFSMRKLSKELMDDPELDPVLHRKALKGLGRLNYLGNAHGIICREIFKGLDRDVAGRVVLDVACGSGDFLGSLFQSYSGEVSGLGLDISPTAINQARQKWNSNIQFQVMDVLDEKVELPICDVAVCSLFFHHLSNKDAEVLLGKMVRSALEKVIILDLERSLFNWLMIGLAAHLVTRSHIVHYDSKRSVEAGWHVSELKALAKKSEAGRFRMKRRFPSWILLEIMTGKEIAQSNK